MQKTYFNSDVVMLPGDILYSSIGRSTYFVGHITIVGADYTIKESIPGKPSGHSLTARQFWGRHNTGDYITLLRSKHGANQAAQWASDNFEFIKSYTILNHDLTSIKDNYCSKWILQAYYYGANIKLTHALNQFVFPQSFKRMKSLEKIAVFLKA